jgi:hypothetical protein
MFQGFHGYFLEKKATCGNKMLQRGFARYFPYPSSIAVAPMSAVMYLNSVIEMLSFGA